MTQMLTRDDRDAGARRSSPGPHPHYTLGTVVVIALVVALVAGGLATGALMITAGRNSVDDSIVAEKVDRYVAETGVPTAAAGSVLPELTPKVELAPAPAGEVNVAFAPDVPPASGRTTQAIVEVHLEIVEGVQAIDPANGVEYETWGFALAGEDGGGVVTGTPGPIVRARVGDVLRLTLTNPASSTHPHNIDLHSVTGQGGGAEATTVAPGESKTIEARLLYPGFFMYHCAYGDVPLHISHGMFGGILVDPEQPLPHVDHEWYVVQSEYYTADGTGVVGDDRASLTMEEPTFVVFNGARGALTGDNALRMQVKETARIYFVNAGLNLDSNFHPIGSHWDAVYQEAALLNQPLRGSQTTLVAAGGGTVVELAAQVPSTIILVDHALVRAFDKGAIGQIVVEGPENPEIFSAVGGSTPTDASGSHDMEGGGEATAAGVAIPAGAGDIQDMGAADEFEDSESIVDYSVNVLRVKVGDTVTWTNQDTMMHTVTAVDGSFDSGFLDQGGSWSHTFARAGEFEYYCLPHPWMRAKVVVEG